MDGNDDSDTDPVERFLRVADRAYDEYEQGYADPDATLSVLEGHIEELRAAHERASDEA